MSEKNNKPIIKKAQDLLKELGHDIKTGHLYEVFSKLSNEASWNVAKSKNLSFEEALLEPFKIQEASGNEPWMVAKKKYLEALNSEDKLKAGEVLLGMLLDEKQNQKLLKKNMEMEPNTLFVGGMGSGKSVAMNVTVLSHLQANPENTLIFLIDPIKGGQDFESLFGIPKVFPVLNSESGIFRVLDLAYDEAMARKDLFLKENINSISDYEKKSGKLMDRVILVFEEFHSTCFQILNFNRDFRTPLTPANKLHQLMRIGRSLGIVILAASQKSTKSDIPPEIIPNFLNKIIFRVNLAESAYFLNSTDAAEIKSHEKGKAFTDYGPVQFPLFSDKEKKEIVQKIKIGEKYHSVYLTESLISDYLFLKNDENVYRLKTIESLINGIEQYNEPLVIKTLHEKLGHKVLTLSQAGVDHLVEIENKKIAVVFSNLDSESKCIFDLYQQMKVHGCSKGIIYTTKNNLLARFYREAFEKNIEIVDRDGMLLLAEKTKS